MVWLNTRFPFTFRPLSWIHWMWIRFRNLFAGVSISPIDGCCQNQSPWSWPWGLSSC